MGRKKLIISAEVQSKIREELKAGKAQYKIAKEVGISPIFISRLNKEFKKEGEINNGVNIPQ